VSSTRRLHLEFPPAAGSDSNEELGHAATAPDRGSRLHRPTPIRRIHATRSAKETVNDSACTLPIADGRLPVALDRVLRLPEIPGEAQMTLSGASSPLALQFIAIAVMAAHRGQAGVMPSRQTMKASSAVPSRLIVQTSAAERTSELTLEVPAS
jgi:hypothetical protein